MGLPQSLNRLGISGEMNTQIEDHTGREIKEGDCIRIESDHNDNEWNSVVIRHSGLFWAKCLSDGDEVELVKVASSCEVLKTFEESVDSGIVKAV